MRISTLALIFSSLFSLSSFAESSPAEYCVKQGGSLVDFVMLDQRRQPTQIKKVLCVFQIENEGWKNVAPETLANPGQSLAVNFFRNPVKLGPSKGAASPAYGYCTKTLKGLYATWRSLASGDESGTCTFADGSMISDWALVYGAQRLPKFDSKFSFQK